MKHRRLALTVLALLALIWSGVGAVMYWTNDRVSWPTRVMDLLEETPWHHGQALSAEARRLYLEKVIRNIILLDLNQSRTLREDAQPLLDRFFASLTTEEQKEFVNRTIERHFDFISRSLKAMPPEERKRVVTRLRGDMRNLRGNSTNGERLSKQDQELLELVVGDDPVLFLRGLPTKEKMELGPVIEEMQSRLQSGRR